MATISPERPGRGKFRVRRSVVGKGKAGKLKPSSSRKTGKQGTTSVPKTQSSVTDPITAEQAIQPDIGQESGVSSGDNWQPEGWDIDNSDYDEDSPDSKANPEQDDKDISNTQENGVNEKGGVGDKEYGPSLADAENNASASDGQDSSTQLNSEGFANDPDKGAWANATKQAGRNAGLKINNRGFRNKRGVFAIVGTVGIVLTLVGAIISIPKLAIDNALDKLTSTFSDRINFAVEKRFEKYVQNYVTKSVQPSLANGRCGRTLTSDCIKVNDGAGLARTFITGLNDARIESRLDRNSGVTFQRREGTNQIDVFQFGNNLGSVDDNISLRQLEDFIRTENNYDGVLKRRDLRSAGKRYGANWCLSFVVNEKICGARNRAEAANRRFSAFKRRQLLLIAKVAEPVSTRGAAALFCLIETSCDIDKNTGLNDSLEIIGQADNEGFKKIVEEIGDKRLSQFLVDKILDVTLRKALPRLATAISSATNPVTVIYTVAVILNLLDNFDTAIDDGAISEFVLEQNTQAALLFLSAMTAAMEEASSFLVPTAEIMATFQTIAGFDRSRFYQSLSGNENLGSLECANGEVIPANSEQLVCSDLNLQPDIPIENFLQGTGVQLGLNTLLSVWRGCIGGVPRIPGVGCPTGTVKGALTPVLEAVDSVSGAVGGAVESGLRLIPGVGGFIDYVGEQFANIIQTIIEKGFPVVIKADAVGPFAFDQIAAGYDFLYNRLLGGYVDEAGQVQGYGAGEISESAAKELDFAIEEWRQEKLAEQSVYARYFDVFNHQSLAASAVTRLSSIIPFTGGTFSPNFMPTSVFSSVGSIFSGRANAIANRSSVFNKANFGITQHAFTLEQLNVDPNTLTESFCEQEKRAYEEALENGDNATSVCMLDEALVSSEGIFQKAFNLDPPGSHTGTGTPGQPSQVIGLNGSYIDCDIHETGGRDVVRAADGANWGGIPPTGTIGNGTDGTPGTPINVYIRNSCTPTPTRTIVLGSSIHGTENGGQLITHELLFNEDLPDDVRVVAIPEINKSATSNFTRKNGNGVDVNRNFDFSWSTLTESKNTDPTSDFYRGPSAASEPETQAVAGFLEQLGPTSLFISFHDRLNYISAVGSTSTNVSAAYVNFLNAGLSEAGIATSRANNIGATRGSMDGWYNNLTDSPSLLVEMTNTRTEAYIDSHVNAIVRMLEDGFVE